MTKPSTGLGRSSVAVSAVAAVPGPWAWWLRRALFSALALPLLGLGVNVVQAAELAIEDPWIREAPPNARALAGYLTIRNPGAADIKLVEVSSAQFERVEMHMTRIEEGRASMQRVTDLNIPAQSGVTFAPNGYHLMLLKPRAPLPAGTSVDWVLHWSDGTTQTVQATVRGIAQN